MPEDQDKRVSEHAYYLWEKEGRPEGRHLEHWTEAERQFGQSQPASSDSEGEGNRTAANAYNRDTKAFVQSGQVEPQARKARADVDGPGGEALRAAEKIGRSHSHGEDPAITNPQPQ